MRALGIAIGLMLTIGTAHAQDPSEARELFEQGYAALVDGRFPEARDLLAQSLEREGRPATAFNLVLALLGTEQPLDAAGVCERLLAGGYGELAADARAEAERECARAEREVGAILVAVDVADAQVAIDGEAVDAAERGPFRVNPGPHVVSASVPDGRRAEGRVRVGRGETVQVTLELGPALDTGSTDSDGAPIWPWIALGAGAAIVIGVVALVLVSSNEGEGELVTDPVFGVTAALH